MVVDDERAGVSHRPDRPDRGARGIGAFLGLVLGAAGSLLVYRTLGDDALISVA